VNRANHSDVLGAAVQETACARQQKTMVHEQMQQHWRHGWQQWQQQITTVTYNCCVCCCHRFQLEYSHS
jgi:hypothetical protein